MHKRLFCLFLGALIIASKMINLTRALFIRKNLIYLRYFQKVFFNILTTNFKATQNLCKAPFRIMRIYKGANVAYLNFL
jgi:hypothetical protein